MLLFVQASASLLADRPAEGLGPIESAIGLMTSGGGTGGILAPEMEVLRGDILAALDGDTGAGPAAEAAWERALTNARRLGVRMSELRAATRLFRAASSGSGRQRPHDLRSIYETFTEGFDTADLVEAREALDAG